MLDLGFRILEIEVAQVPTGSVPKKRAPEYYHVLRDERPELD